MIDILNTIAIITGYSVWAIFLVAVMIAVGDWIVELNERGRNR